SRGGLGSGVSVRGAQVFAPRLRFRPWRCAGTPYWAVSGCLQTRSAQCLRAFPELSETEIARVVAGMWDNLGRLAAEYPHLRNIRIFEPGGGSRRMASNMWIVRSQPAGG